MAPPSVPNALLKKTLKVFAAHKGNQTHACVDLGIARTTLQNRLLVAQQRGLKVPTFESDERNKQPSKDTSAERVRRLLQVRPISAREVAETLNIKLQEAKGHITSLRRAHNLFERGGLFSIEKAPVPHTGVGERFEMVSDAAGYHRFGFVTDNHYGSKYCREDVNEILYDWFAAEGVDRVMNAGNWIEGEFPGNKFDISVYGMQPQLDYFAEHYPRRKGIVTDFIAGDDHEGWYSQREGVDIGKMAENTAREKGREDLRYLGYMEAFISLRRPRGPISRMLVCHPGGGSAYATSYAPQKFVESLQGGEKPAVILFGHWHKIFDLLIRNVVCLGGGCTKDLDPFGRKFVRGGYNLGGMIVELWQDERGAIERHRVATRQFFDRGYYNDQFSKSARPSRQAA